MRPTIYLFLLLTLFSSLTSCRRPFCETEKPDNKDYNISVSDAKAIALRFFTESDPAVKADLTDINVLPFKKTDTTFAYVCNLSTGGFAIVSADTRMFPILGYSIEDSIGFVMVSIDLKI